MGRGEGSTLLYGPAAPRQHQEDLTLDDIRAIHTGELEYFDPLLREWATKDPAEKPLQDLCSELRGRTVLIAAQTAVKTISEPGSAYATWTLPYDRLFKVLSAVPGRKIEGWRPSPAELFLEADGTRLKVDLCRVAVLFPIDVTPRLPGGKARSVAR